MSKITLLVEKFEFEAVIGLLESERTAPQKVEVWAKITVDYKKNEIVDYANICDIIKNSMQKKNFFTVEEALLYISDKIAEVSPKIRKVYLKILKPDILENRAVGGEIQKKF